VTMFFWQERRKRVLVLDAETGKFFDLPEPQGFWSWLFSRDTWFRIR
jgi:hypothetical protein